MDKKPHIKPYLYGMLAGFGAISLSIIFFFLIYRFDGFGRFFINPDRHFLETVGAFSFRYIVFGDHKVGFKFIMSTYKVNKILVFFMYPGAALMMKLFFCERMRALTFSLSRNYTNLPFVFEI